MHTTRLDDGTEVFCLRKSEARAIDGHVEAYLRSAGPIGPNAVVIDIGANIGLFAVRVAKALGPHSKVFAFEPVPPIFDVLSANIARHAPGQVTPLQMAMGRTEGSLQMTYYPRSPALSTAHPDIWGEQAELLTHAVQGGARHSTEVPLLGRLLPRFAARLIARYLRGQAQQLEVPKGTVSTLMREQGLTSVDLLKVDVEGAELEVLEGVANEHWPHIRRVVAEVHDVDGRVEKISALLRAAGFQHLKVEVEPGFEQSDVRNVYAMRN